MPATRRHLAAGPDEASDEELYSEYRLTQSPVAFGELVSRWRLPLCKFFRGKVANCDVDDLVQEVWLQLMTAENYDVEQPFRTYLIGIAVNVWRMKVRFDHLPCRNVEQAISFSDLDAEGMVSLEAKVDLSQ